MWCMCPNSSHAASELTPVPLCKMSLWTKPWAFQFVSQWLQIKFVQFTSDFTYPTNSPIHLLLTSYHPVTVLASHKNMDEHIISKLSHYTSTPLHHWRIEAQQMGLRTKLGDNRVGKTLLMAWIHREMCRFYCLAFYKKKTNLDLTLSPTQRSPQACSRQEVCQWDCSGLVPLCMKRVLEKSSLVNCWVCTLVGVGCTQLCCPGACTWSGTDKS